jgi:hypothetical protein
MALIDHRAIAHWKPNARPADGWPFLSKEKLQELRESGSRASRAQDIVQIMDFLNPGHLLQRDTAFKKLMNWL